MLCTLATMFFLPTLKLATAHSLAEKIFSHCGDLKQQILGGFFSPKAYLLKKNGFAKVPYRLLIIRLKMTKYFSRRKKKSD